eukprot:1160627-Pelagomonas_calceolata.AAC.2
MYASTYRGPHSQKAAITALTEDSMRGRALTNGSTHACAKTHGGQHSNMVLTEDSTAAVQTSRMT